MADMSPLEAARARGASAISGLARRLGLKWPLPPTSPVRDPIRCLPDQEWNNYPQTLSIKPLLTCTPESIDDIIAAIRNAEANHQQVHAFGSKWSFSDCAVGLDPANACLIDMTRLTNPVQTVQKALTGGDPSLVYHVEAGITIHDLYTSLDGFVDKTSNQNRPLALLTMGGSSGQTLAGAISTGTHGGDYRLPPLADSVLALHLIGPGGNQYWIEPTPGITNPPLLQQYVLPGIDRGNIIYDTATFDACLVSLGLIGIIYAVVLKVRDQYNLIETTMATTWQDFLGTASARLNDPNGRFLQVALDPYTDSSNNNQCLVTTRTEGGGSVCSCTQGNVNGAIITLIEDLFSANPIEAIGVAVQTLADLIHSGVDPLSNIVNRALVALVNSILLNAPDLRSVLTKDYGKIMSAIWPPVTCGGKSFCVMDTSLRKPGTNAQPPGAPASPAYSIEMFFPATDGTPGHLPWADFVNGVIATVNAATDTFLTGYIGIRFMGSTRALLGMQQWAQTCSVEISTLGGVTGELALLTRILDMMYKSRGLPHWGQMIDLNVQGHGNLYPGYQKWRRVYQRMSNNFTTRTFENALAVRWQLTTP